MDSSQSLSEAIRKLPLELREKILKELIATKIRERASLGWNCVHFQNLLTAVKIRERKTLGWEQVNHAIR